VGFKLILLRMKLFLALTVTAFVAADVYLHNPRGSNNRLDDQNRDRNNGNRLFDSQNNNRGGANVGQVYYYAGSQIPFEWSQQHSCGNPNNHCEIIIQYMCDSKLRDGTTTNTIPEKPEDCYDYDCDTDVRFGRHESYEWYMDCKYRERNKGLFTSSQNVKGSTARYTRQNPNGARRGYECPEERDYYPYWHPSPWKDLAILTNQPQRCEAYKAESENVKGKFYCQVPVLLAKQWYHDKKNKKRQWIPIHNINGTCNNYTVVDTKTNTTYQGKWVQKASHGLPAPECQSSTWSRDNHHGNVEGGQWSGFNWTVPDSIISEQCAIRLRYNISTGDMPHFGDNPASLMEPVLNSELNYQNGKQKKKNNGQDPSLFPIAERFFNNKTYAKEAGMKVGAGGRDYTLRNNPQVDIWGYDKVRFQLAVNTAQYGRTFQDRTHRFAIRKPPSSLGEKPVIHNVQVRGKRGNIVQTYPGTEYDYVPNRLECRNGDYVHFQWTGSNTNPNNNAGQGRQGSDRHNVVALKTKVYEEPGSTDQTSPATRGHWGSSYPAKLDDFSFLGFSRTEMQNLAILDQTGQFGGEMSELDDAGTYFDAGPRKCTTNGVFNYMCTRNNNFSNRSQKGKIRVTNQAIASKRLDMTGGSFSTLDGSAQLSLKAGDITNAQTVTIATTPATDEDAAMYVEVDNLQLVAGKTVSLSLEYSGSSLHKPSVYYRANDSAEWESVDWEWGEDGQVKVEAPGSGRYKVDKVVDGGEVTGLVFGILAAGAIGVYIYKKRKAGGKSMWVSAN